MFISDYKYIINRETFSCGIVLNFRLYDLSFFNNKYLSYKVRAERKEISVYSDENEVIFQNINKELLYYAFKTESLVIILGTTKRKISIKKHFEAFLD